jgi:hypothetical protein
MLHRSTLLAILSVALLLPAAAQAADPVVAGPTAAGTTATAHVARDRLCVTVQLARPTPEQQQQLREPACAPLPVLGPLGFDDGLAGTGSDTTYDAGVTGSDIAAVELRKDGRTLAHAATQPSPLPAAGDLRFYLLETTTTPDEVVFLDATGTVRRAADFIGVRYGFSDRGPQQTAARTLAHGTGGGGRWRLSVYAIRPIVSTPLQPERRLTLACTRLTLSGGGESDDSTSCNAPGLEAKPMLPTDAEDGCGAVGRFVGALVRPEVAKVVLVLGSGRRVTMTLRAIPAELGGTGLRSGLARVDAHQAVRSITAYDRAGHAIDHGLSSLAPGSPPRCQGGSGDGEELSGSSEVLYASSGSHTARLGAAPHQLHAADAGAQICFAADRAPVAPADCQEPPTDPAAAFLSTQPTADGRLVLGIVPPEVASARVTLDDGSTRDLPAGPIAGYGGQYASSLAAIAGDVPGPHRVLTYQLRDARGRVLADGVGPELAGLRNTRRVAQVPGVGPLYFSDVAVVPSVRYALADLGGCLSVGRPPAGTALVSATCLPHSRSIAMLTPSCATRRMVVSVGLAHRTDHVAIRLASGREVALRTYPLPAQKGDSLSVAQAIGVLGAHDVPRTLIRRGGKPQRLALHLPAAAAQCGYSDLEFLDEPSFD